MVQLSARTPHLCSLTPLLQPSPDTSIRCRGSRRVNTEGIDHLLDLVNYIRDWPIAVHGAYMHTLVGCRSLQR